MKEQIIHATQDLTYLSWSKIRRSSGAAGSFLKAYSELGGKKIYYKLSNYDSVSGIVGHESVNELIVDRLLTILGIEHLSYQLIHSEIILDGKKLLTYVCASEDFKGKDEDKIALDAFYGVEHREDESPLQFCVRMGWGEYIWKMLVVDYLILNRDRHGANIEVLRNKKKKTLRLAPLFDHGLSLLCSCLTDKAVERFDIMEDRRIQSFVGSFSAQDNLKLIPADHIPLLGRLKESDRETLLDGLHGIISERLQDKIWDMIWKRWCNYEDFCDSRRQ